MSLAPPRVIGRYLLFDEIAAGGMATVHVARLLGPAGFSRTVAIKRLHPPFARDADFVSMFLDEARLAARIRHPNVVSTLDVVAGDGELFLVMDYVQGLSVSKLAAAVRRANVRIPPRITAAIAIDTLVGLQAAHEATNDRGEALGIVHRDVSPQNILLGADGIARVADFGVAKAASRTQTTREGHVKGKLAYMAPEQIQSQPVDARSDVFATSIVLWELLTGKRLFAGDDPAAVMAKILMGQPDPPSRHAPDLDSRVDAIVLRGLARSQSARFGSAREMARALEIALPRAGSLEVEEWLARVAGDLLQTSGARVAEIESASAPSAVGLDFELSGLTPRPALPAGGIALGAALGAASSAAFGAGPSVAFTSAPARAPEPRILPRNTLELPRGLEERSEVTDLSASRPTAQPRLPERSRRAKIALALAGLVTLAAGTFALLRPEPPAPPAPAAASVLRPATEEHLMVAPPERTVSAVPSVAPLAQSAPLATTRATAETTRARQSRPVRALSQARNPSAADCTPPYVLKPDGTKRFKPECF